MLTVGRQCQGEKGTGILDTLHCSPWREKLFLSQALLSASADSPVASSIL